MTVSVLTEKNLRQSGQWNGMVLWVQGRARSLRQCGQHTPAGQRPSMNHCSAAARSRAPATGLHENAYLMSEPLHPASDDRAETKAENGERERATAYQRRTHARRHHAAAARIRGSHGREV